MCKTTFIRLKLKIEITKKRKKTSQQENVIRYLSGAILLNHITREGGCDDFLQQWIPGQVVVIMIERETDKNKGGIVSEVIRVCDPGGVRLASHRT